MSRLVDTENQDNPQGKNQRTNLAAKIKRLLNFGQSVSALTSMLIDKSPFKRLPQKRIFENTGIQGSLTMYSKRVNAGPVNPEDCTEMKHVESSLQIDEIESTLKGEEIPSPPAALKSETSNLESLSQPQRKARRYPPPKIRSGVPVFRQFPPNMHCEPRDSLLEPDLADQVPSVHSIQKGDDYVSENVHEEFPPKLEILHNYEMLGAKESNDLNIVSFDDYHAMVARLKVREALNLFRELHKILSGKFLSKSKSTRWKIISKASTLLKQHKKWVNTHERLIGAIPGIVVGDRFQFRAELVVVGLHQQFSSSIDFLKKDGMVLATSIVCSNHNVNGTDLSDSLIYSGQGGIPVTGYKEPEDQKLGRGNLALKNSMDARTPVRVIRSHQSCKAPNIYIYDGLYLVSKCWQEKEAYGKLLVFKFKLDRIKEWEKLTFGKASTVGTNKTKLDCDGCVMDDLSEGKENIPIRVVNKIDDETPPPFTYITKMVYPRLRRSPKPRSCNCTNGCSDFVKCSCVIKNEGEIPYNDNGAIVRAKPMVYECGPSCKCPPSCKNRVAQRGIRYRLEVFKTEKRGWGVRSKDFIPSGGFVCEYIGEILGDNEADDRTGDDEYLFDIGNNYGNFFFGDGKDSLKRVDDNDFAIDAAHSGNIGRFINHSCSPCLYAQNVFYDHDDKRLPHIMLFATKNIKPLQELTYDYNYKIDQVYDSHGNIKRKVCYCGARGCTGRLY